MDEPAAPEAVLISSHGLEYSVHLCPSKCKREVQSVFPGLDTSCLIIVPTCQQARMELVQMGEAVEQEKDLLLERFTTWAQLVCGILQSAGYWSDYIDPCSGLPMLHSGNNVYSEVEAFCTLLNYKVSNAGCCKILLHPKWGSAVYPASMFTLAPRKVLQEAIAQVEARLAVGEL